MVDLNQDKLIQFLHTVHTLKHFTRRSVTLNGEYETVAAHSWGCLMLYSRLKRVFPIHDELCVYRYLADHDVCECVSGDVPYDVYKDDPMKKVEKIIEEQTTAAILDDIICDMTPPVYPMTYYEKTLKDLSSMKSIESRIVRVIDVLEWNSTLYLALAYGAREARDTAISYFTDADWDSRAVCMDEFPIIKLFNNVLKQKIKNVLTCVQGM